MEAFTEKDRAFLKGKNFGHFATLMPDGSPQVTPVWVDVDDEGYLLVNSSPGRVKDVNVRIDPRVALSVEDTEDPYSWIAIRGTVVDIVTEGAWEHINELSMRYEGEPYPEEGERVIYRIAPESIARPWW